VKDPVFYLTKPSEQKQDSKSYSQCNVCEKDLQEDSMVLCEFCNTPNNCKQCCSKKFPFAQESRPDQNSPDEEFVEDSIFGQICKICETKIYVKKYHEEVDQQVQKHKKNKINKQQELKVL
jgi:hypothetical protein